jgi:superfamily II DNA/RNA helicase
MYKKQKRSFGKKRSFNKKEGGRKEKSSKHFSKYIKSSKFVNKSEQNKDVYVPENKFIDFDIDKKLKENISKKGYETPTEIQDKTIPLILKGKDVIGVANTGTGKTGAFLLPLIDKVFKNKKQKVFIITPTRELAFQIDEELFSLTKDMNIRSVVCIGGSNMFNQVKKIKENPSFVIGTPGRLKDLVMRKKLSIKAFSNIVIDEADRMLDMGFLDDVRFLTNELCDVRQSLLFSATISPEIEKVINSFSKDPVKVSVKTRETAENVEQDIVRTNSSKEKIEKLCKFLENKKEFKKVLIFGRTRRGVENLSKDLNKKGFTAVSIHGDKTQSKRQQALSLFKKGGVQSLVATDVAARGLDINNVSHVINFDVPATYDDYIHRIGRTGRGDKTGIALTFV